jgi:hypothetical protein
MSLAEGVVANFLAVGSVANRVAAQSLSASSEVIVAPVLVPIVPIAANLKNSTFATTSRHTARTTFATLGGSVFANLGLAGPLTIRAGGKLVRP